MYPYRLDTTSQPTSPTPPTVPVATPTKPKRRIGTVAVLSLALTTGAVGGAALGTVAAARWLAPQSVTSPAPTTQPISTTASSANGRPQLVSAAAPAATNVAGTVFAKVNAGVVEIQALGQTQLGTQTFGSGSGFVVDTSGLILTNNHVVEGARAVSVRFSSGEQREATVLGTDRGNDLALLKVDLPEGVPAIALGDSEQVQVGETAIAIGSPFGLEQSVTQGIISAVHRDWISGNGRLQRNLLQTDAPINPGNSGGPLLNERGEVIGINTMIESPVRGSVGVGFAVPINTAQRLLPQLEAGTQLEPVWLGISGQELDATIAKDQGLSVEQGVLITDIVPGSPADEAGLRGGQGSNENVPRGGDVITAVDGNRVTTIGELTEQLAEHKPGDSVSLTIVRDGREQTVAATLQAWPEQQPSSLG